MQVSISKRTLATVVVAVVVVAATWLLVNWLVVTDTKRIDRMLEEAARAVERNDIDYIVDNCLDPEFKFATLDREGTRQWMKDAVQRFDVKGLRKYSNEVTLNGDSAHATMRAFVSGGRLPGDQRLDWEIDLHKRGGEHWGIRGVRIFYFLMGERRELDPELILHQGPEF